VVITAMGDINAIMKTVPKGKVITLKEICQKLAKQHQVQYCCTLTSGIGTMIAANAAEEMDSDVPWWRTLKMQGELNKKFPGGLERQKTLLEQEGHTIIQRGIKHLRYFVQDYEKKLLQ
jgi:alkylated DNA nucleotide flippase Atl1